MARVSDDKLKSILQAEKADAMGDAYGTSDSDLATQRARAMDFYQGDMGAYMPVGEGRSKALSTDVADTVDSLMPVLMEIFMGSDEVVRFTPSGEGDEEAAGQETDYVNHCFFVDNPGFTILHAFIKDALISKNGIVKYWWDEGDEEQRETYTGLSDDAFAMVAAEEKVEIIERNDYEGEGEYGPEQLHDATVIMRKPYGRVKVMAVPPEEFLIARDAKSIEDSRYCAHVTKKPRSELIDDGYPRAIIDDLPTGTSTMGIEQDARATVNDNDDAYSEGSDVNKAMQLVEITEHFIRVDYDGDGIAELRKVTTAGTAPVILDNEPYDRFPFAAITPILMSHRFWGRSLADIVEEIQKINTALTRSMLDNIYYMNSQRLEIAESHASENTIEDVLTNRPGAPIRTKLPGGINPIISQPIVQHIMPVIEHMHMMRETRTGVARHNAGPQANAINPYNSTATGANIVATAGQQRIRLIARTFAETGIKDLFIGIHELILKHGQEARQVKLRNEWVTIDPRQWKTRKEMEILVGLGTGTKDQIMQHLMVLAGYQEKILALQGGPNGPMIKWNNLYSTVKKITENAGFRDVQPFFEEPPRDMPPPKPQPDPRVIEAQGKLQLQAQKQQGEAALKQQSAQADTALKQQQGAASIAQKQQEHTDEMQLQASKNAADMQMKQYEVRLEGQMEVFKAQLEANTDLQIAGIKSSVDAAVAEMKALLEAKIALERPIRPGGKVG